MTRKRDTRKGDTLGARIRAARQAQDLSTAKLARELDVDTRTVARWQADDSTPSVVRLTQIAQILNKPVSYFLDGQEVAA